MKLRFLVLALAASILLLTACTTVNMRIHSDQAAFDAGTPQQQALIRSGKIGLGFTKAMVKMALADPDRVSVRADSSGLSEIWTYFRYVPAESYFDEYPQGGRFALRSNAYHYGRSEMYSTPSYITPYSFPRRSASLRDDVMRVTFKAGVVVAYEGPYK